MTCPLWSLFSGASLVVCSSSVHRARFDVPDVPGALGNRPVAREPPRRRDVENRLARPLRLIPIHLAESLVRRAVALEIGEVQVVVAFSKQDVENRLEHAGLVPAEVIGGDEIER